METVSVSIGLTNPKSPSNVGAVMRAAGCYQVDSVFYTGDRFDRAAKYNTDTKCAHETIPLKRVDNFTEDCFDKVKLICVELVEGATPLPEFEHPDRAIYLFGPEDGSLEQSIIDKADAVIYIPTIGCMNLAATVNVVLYDRLAKSDSELASDELIHRSRDTNNKTKVKLA